MDFVAVRAVRLSLKSRSAGPTADPPSHKSDAESQGIASAPGKAGLSLLLEAQHLAVQVARDPWDFAVEIGAMERVGMTNSLLRWLVCKGLLEHGRETTPDAQTARTFHCFGGLRFFRDTCFVLTSSGVEFAQQSLAVEKDAQPVALYWQCNGTCQVPAVVPKWDRLRQQLRLWNVLVKQFKARAENQQRILNAFEEEGWPCRIDDPLPPIPDQDSKRRLHATINSLNRKRKHALLRFVGDGSGTGIRWEVVESAEDLHAATRVAKVSSSANGNGKAAVSPRLPR